MKPVFRYFPDVTFKIKEKENLNKRVVVDGSPFPVWSCWITSRDKIERKVPKENYNEVLFNITNVSYLNDNGTQFSCNASNLNHTVLKSFWLNVLGKIR